MPHEQDLECHVIVTLGERGFVRVTSEAELPQAFGHMASGTKIKSTLSGLIERDVVVRARRHPESMSDMDRPITYFLAAKPVPAHVTRHRIQ